VYQPSYTEVRVFGESDHSGRGVEVTRVITDDQMREMLKTVKPYTLVVLHSVARQRDAGAAEIIWEHGRRNLELRAQGLLVIVCPVRDGSDVAGICIFTTNSEETKAIMDGDPAVQAGILTYEIHPTRGFPGSTLP
jgi:hypothetical protein